MQTNPIIWFEIYVNDLDRARKFYEQVLGYALEALPTPDSQDDGMKMLSFPQDMQKMGAGGALVKMEGMNAGGNSTIVYFGSNDCSVEEGKVAAAGGKVFKSKESLGDYGFMALAYDTEGNLFGIHSME